MNSYMYFTYYLGSNLGDYFSDKSSIIRTHTCTLSPLEVGWITVFKATLSNKCLYDYQCMVVHISECIFS